MFAPDLPVFAVIWLFRTSVLVDKVRDKWGQEGNRGRGSPPHPHENLVRLFPMTAISGVSAFSKQFKSLSSYPLVEPFVHSFTLLIHRMRQIRP